MKSIVAKKHGKMDHLVVKKEFYGSENKKQKYDDKFDATARILEEIMIKLDYQKR